MLCILQEDALDLYNGAFDCYVYCREIDQLLNVSFAHGSSDDNMLHLKESYILLVNVNVMESQSAWSGKTVDIQASAETTINLSELQVSARISKLVLWHVRTYVHRARSKGLRFGRTFLSR